MTQFELGFATRLAQAEKRGESDVEAVIDSASGGLLASTPIALAAQKAWRGGGKWNKALAAALGLASPITGLGVYGTMRKGHEHEKLLDMVRAAIEQGVKENPDSAFSKGYSSRTKVAFPGANLAKSVAGKAKAGVKAVKDFGATVSGSKATKAEDRAFRALREGSKNPFSYTHYTHIDDVPASVREAASKGKTFGNTTFKLAPHGQVEMSSAGGDSRKIKALLLRAAREEERRLASRTAVGGVATGVGGLAVGNALAEEKKAAIRTAITEKLAQAGLLGEGSVTSPAVRSTGSQNLPGPRWFPYERPSPVNINDSVRVGPAPYARPRPLITGAPGATGATAKNPFSSYSHIPGEAGASASGAEGRVSSLISKLKKINPKLAALLAGISAVGVGTGYALNHKSQGASPSVPTESGTPTPGSTPDINQLLGQAKDWIIQNKYPLLAGAATTAVAAPALSYMFGKRAQYAPSAAMQGMEAAASHPNPRVSSTALSGLNEVGRTNGSFGARAGRLLSHLYAGPSVSAPRVNLPRSFTSANPANLKRIQGLGSGL